MGKKKQSAEEQQVTYVTLDAAKENAPKAVQNGEYLLRMQFLHQATRLLATTAEEEKVDLVTARHYICEAKNMAKRHVLRSDPSLKQLYCKRCSCILPRATKEFFRQMKKKKATRVVDCSFCAFGNHIPEKYWTPDIQFLHPKEDEEEQKQD